VIECHSDPDLFHRRLAGDANRREGRFAALQQTFHAKLRLDDICSVLYAAVRIGMTSVPAREKEVALDLRFWKKNGRRPAEIPSGSRLFARSGKIDGNSLIRHFIRWTK
jgi:hypothetical protein